MSTSPLPSPTSLPEEQLVQSGRDPRDRQPLQKPPKIPWPTLRSRLVKDWEPGEHITLVGPTGSGKTHMALALAELCRYSLIIATKREDPLLASLAHRHKVTTDLSEVLWAAEGNYPIDKRVMYWPKFPEKMGQRERLAKQAQLIRKALDWADKTGNWAIVLDELMWVSRNLGLEKEIESVYFQGRTQGVSMIGAAQRPSHVPLLAFSQARYLFLWQSNDRRDLERLREISAGLPPKMIEACVRQLDWKAHEALFIDVKQKEVARVVGPATL